MPKRFARVSGATSLRGGLALVVAAALGAAMGYTGTAVAAGLVTGRQIKDGTVRSVDLRTDRGITGTDVRDGTLSASKMAPLPRGAVGDQGPPGPRGVNGLANAAYAISGPIAVAAGTEASFTAPCSAGRAVGGGASSTNAGISLSESQPLASGSGWQVTVFNGSGLNADVFGWADCVSAP